MNRVPVLSLVLLLAAPLAPTWAEPSDLEETLWDLGTLEAGKVYPTTVAAVNNSCPGAHTVTIQLHGAPWLRVTGPKQFDGLRPGDSRTSPAELDTRGLTTGLYEGWIRLRCTTCPPPPRCYQNIGLVHVVFRIPGILERLGPGGDTTTSIEAPPSGDTAPPEEPCETTEVEGRFQPTQAVWQDDPVFEDQPTKQLSQLNPTLFEAELHMVKDRLTILSGTIRPVGGTFEWRRYEIFIRGKAQGTRPVAVKFRFWLSEGGSRRFLWESPVVARVPLGPPCKPGDGEPFEASIDAGDGLPPKGEAFTFSNPGGYTLTAELVTESGFATGLRTQVIGEVVETTPPRILFQPVLLDPGGPIDESALRSLTGAAIEVEGVVRVHLADSYPMASTLAATRWVDARVLTPTARDHEAARLFKEQHPEEDAGGVLRALLSEALTRQLQAAGAFTHFDRVVALLTTDDFDKMRTGAAAAAAALTNSQKVVFVDWLHGGFTQAVKHELAHTLPFPWTSEQIEAECGRNFHNAEVEMVGTPVRIANGFSVTFRGEESRQRIPNTWPMMGKSRRGEPYFITQCTYWHLLKQLVEGPPDPPVILVQGYIARGEAGVDGVLLPAYQFDAVADLEEGTGGDWAIQLRTRKGKKLGRFPFEPIFAIPHGEERRAISFSYRVPDDPRVGRIDLVGPGGVLDTLTYSDHAPVVAIAPAEPAEGRVRIEWTGTDADGDELLYAVFYSSDGGESWVPLAFEQIESFVEVQLEPEATDHAVRVIATDGARSGEARVDFVVEGAPESGSES